MRLVRLWGFIPVVALVACTTTPPAPDRVAWSPTIEYRDGMIRGVPSAFGCVALTFDDGPHPSYTPRLLRILEEEAAVATFFVVGRQIERSADAIAAMRSAGHEIGNHSWSHLPLPSLSSEAVLREIAATDAAVRSVTGAEPTVIRFPYGSTSERVLALTDRPVIFWTVDSNDWNGYSTDQIARSVVGRARSGSIVLMHDTHSRTVAAVRSIIRSLRAEGYELVTMSRLLTGRPCR